MSDNEKKTERICGVCGSDLDNQDPEGVRFTAKGNWASSVYDNFYPQMGYSTFIELWVCDECLKGRVGDRIYHVKVIQKNERTEEPFRKWEERMQKLQDNMPKANLPKTELD